MGKWKGSAATIVNSDIADGVSPKEVEAVIFKVMDFYQGCRKLGVNTPQRTFEVTLLAAITSGHAVDMPREVMHECLDEYYDQLVGMVEKAKEKEEG